MLYSLSLHTVLLIELTVPLEDQVAAAPNFKTARYASPMSASETNGFKAIHFAVEVGSRGFVAPSLSLAYATLVFLHPGQKVRNECSRVALRSSYIIYIRRAIETWRNISTLSWFPPVIPDARLHVISALCTAQVWLGVSSHRHKRPASANVRLCRALWPWIKPPRSIFSTLSPFLPHLKMIDNEGVLSLLPSSFERRIIESLTLLSKLNYLLLEEFELFIMIYWEIRTIYHDLLLEKFKLFTTWEIWTFYSAVENLESWEWIELKRIELFITWEIRNYLFSSWEPRRLRVNWAQENRTIYYLRKF